MSTKIVQVNGNGNRSSFDTRQFKNNLQNEKSLNSLITLT